MSRYKYTGHGPGLALARRGLPSKGGDRRRRALGRAIHVHPDGKVEHPLASNGYDGLHAGSRGAAVVEDAGKDAGLRSLDVAHLLG